MVLEESLVFNSKESASEFIGFLRKGGCKGRLVQKKYTIEEELLIGSVDSLIAMMDDRIEEYQASESEEDYEVPQLWELLDHKKSVSAIKEGLTEISETYKSGDLIYSTEEQNARLMETMASFIEDPENEAEKDRVEKGLNIMALQMVLNDNGLTEEREGDIYLTKPFSAGELILGSVQFRTIMSDSLHLEEYDISERYHCYVDLMYEVEVDPKIYFAFSPEDILSFIQDLEVDEESLENFHDQMRENMLIIAQFLTRIEQAGPISLEKFTELMKNPPEDEDLPEEPDYNFTPEFIAAIVSELRKLRVIKGNNRNIHI